MEESIAANKNTKGTSKVSLEQRQKMLEFMKGNVEFARGRVTGPDAARQKNKKLQELADILNSCGSGASKPPKKWLKSWQDWRCDTKAKALKIDKYYNGTGGGPCPPPLSGIEDSLMEFCGREMVAGVPDVTDPLEIQRHSPPPQEQGPSLDEGLLHEEAERVLENPNPPEVVPVAMPKQPTKRKDLHELLERQAIAIEQGFADMAAALREVANALRDQQKIIISP